MNDYNGVSCFLFVAPFYQFSFSTFTPASLVYAVRNICYAIISATPRETFNINIDHCQTGCCHKGQALKNCSQFLMLDTFGVVIEIVSYFQLHLSIFY